MVTYDVRQDESVSDAVLRAVAAFHEVDATELPPLYDVVEPDALNSLSSNRGSHGPFTGLVSFKYTNVIVEVDGGSRLTVSVSTEPTDRQHILQHPP
jgi:hypothetical protein